MAAEHVLAVDQGTTGTTVVVVGPDGRVAGRGYAEFGQHYPRPGWVEHDPEEIWTVTRRVAGKALEDAGLRATDLAGVGITNQRETTVLWERGTGRPVAPAVVWQDRRTAPFCRRLEHDGLAPMIRRTTGLLIDSYISATKIRWLLDNVEGLRGRAERGEIAFGTIDSWLLAKLTGGRVHATDCTNASRTLLMDLDALTWDDELCEVFGVPAAVLPEIRPSATVFGETDADVNRKLQSALAVGLKPILCVGESESERDAGQTEAVLYRQMRDGLGGVDLSETLVVAYEPVWAIGSGRAANGEQAQAAIAFIRSQLHALGGALSERVRLLYGGSVTAVNIAEFMGEPDVDGALVGGASLSVASFAGIVEAAARVGG